MTILRWPSPAARLLTKTPGETAASYVTRQVPIVNPEATANDIRDELQGRRFESVDDVVVCESGKLVGLIRIEDALAAPPDAIAEDLMDKDPPVVQPSEDQEVAAWKAVHHREGSLAVVDKDGTFVGLIPPPALIEIFLHEHEEDLARLGGYLRGTSAARSVSEEPIPRRFWHKVPWLVIGLIGAIISADIVGAFEGRLEQNVMIAFFLPGIVYLADAVGTQTETVVVRGLSVGVGVKRFAVKEILTGVLVGAALAAAFLPIGLLRWDSDLALAVCLSLLAACSVATIVAMTLPALLHALGRDPAFGSGPLATVIQDMLSIIIYLSISTTLVN